MPEKLFDPTCLLVFRIGCRTKTYMNSILQPLKLPAIKTLSFFLSLPCIKTPLNQHEPFPNKKGLLKGKARVRIKPLPSCGKPTKWNNVPVMQAAQEEHFFVKGLFIEISYFFYHSNTAILKFGFVCSSVGIVNNSAETISCLLYIPIGEAPRKTYSTWNS